MSSTKENVEQAENRAEELRSEILDFLNSPEAAFVVSAAPGSGKSSLLLSLAKEIAKNEQTVVVATATNNQADDLVKTWLKDPKADRRIVRLASKRMVRDHEIDKDNWMVNYKDVPELTRVTITTSSSLALICSRFPETRYDYLFVEEAYQTTWAKFMQISALASKVLFIGDQGQIPPVVTLDGKKWDTASSPPNWPAPLTLELMSEKSGTALNNRFRKRELTTSWRIPKESLELVRPFYEELGVELIPVAEASERQLIVSEETIVHPQFCEAIKLGKYGKPVLLTLAQGANKVPARADTELCSRIAEFLSLLFDAQAHTSAKSFKREENYAEKTTKLKLTDVMILATKRELLANLEHALQPVIAKVKAESSEPTNGNNGGLFIDTPERAQGLQRPVVIVVHPLSAVSNPGEFDLETGRLSVMISRHQNALFVFSRDGVGESLKNNLPSAEQALGRPDKVGKSHKQHVTFWNWFGKEQTVKLG